MCYETEQQDVHESVVKFDQESMNALTALGHAIERLGTVFAATRGLELESEQEEENEEEMYEARPARPTRNANSTSTPARIKSPLRSNRTRR
jgi:hypothetical protein